MAGGNALSWSAQQYVAFEDERTRAVRDLLNSLPALPVRTGVDLGCGPGNSTEVLATRFPDATLLGLDSSADMIAAARQRLPQVRFELADIAGWHGAERYDVMLANAVLHWLPDHERLLPALVRRLNAGGALAVQMPDNLEEPAALLMREIAQRGPWSAKLDAAAGLRTPLGSADGYYRLLRAHATRVEVWRTTYHHPLADGAAGVVEWFKGSGLRPFLAPLNETERAAYLREYATAVAAAYPPLADGSVLLPFPRLFMVALR